MTTLVVVDDQFLIRDGVAAILAAEEDFTVLGTAADGAEAVGLITTLAPDVALMDIRMPEVDGIEATRRIVESGCATRILILTTFGADDYVLAALRAGASGYLLKDAPRDSLVAAIRAVAAGDVTVEKGVLAQLVRGQPTRQHPAVVAALGRLSPRESEVLHLVGQGATNPEIAQSLFVTRKNVEFHLSNAYRKLQIGSRRDLSTALQNGGTAD